VPIHLTHRLSDALALAIDLHAGQVRKGTEIPYVAHLLAVAAIVLEHGGSEEEAIAALLHDAIEDAKIGAVAARTRILESFDESVLAIIEECSDASPEPDQPKGPWLERKEAYIAHLADASPSALLVSGADKLHNARSLLADYQEVGDMLWARFNADPDKISWFYKAVADAITERANQLPEEPAESKAPAGPRRLARTLSETVQQLKAETMPVSADPKVTEPVHRQTFTGEQAK
jgi:GTP pyrophosphokinase